MSMTPPRILPTGEPPTGQVAFVTQNLDSAVARWVDLGIGPWNVWTFDGRLMTAMEYDGKPAQFGALVALCSIGPLTYEVIEPLSGPSIWDDFLGARGEGMHHLGYYVDDMTAAIEAMSMKGYSVVQFGAGFGIDGDGAFAYFDATAELGCYLEAILSPSALAPPQRTIP
jgi:catechol 2,3-dioxygenase-like lactoylglutathione lyase family enzyme